MTMNVLIREKLDFRYIELNLSVQGDGAMKGLNMGVGSKIFIGFIALILIGAITGAAGFLSLGRVTTAGNVNVFSEEVRGKILEARILEKEYLTKKDEGTYNKLIQCLAELATLTSGLQTRMGKSGVVAEIADAQQAYKKAVVEIKKLEEDDAKALKDLQDTGKEVAAIAEDEAAKAASVTKKEILDNNAKALKDYALKEIRNITALGYEVLQFYHDQAMSKEAALEAVRNLHFDGTNYFFVVQEDLTLVAHGSDRSLEGKDFGKIQDKKTGKTFVKEVVEGAVRNGESSTEYFWNKPGMGDAVFPKVTCGKYFKPWGLVICAGVYIEDIEKQVAKTGETIAAGLNRLQQANDINALMMQARLNALYFTAFGQNAEKVHENLSQLKGLAVSNDKLKQKTDVYLETFDRLVRNDQAREKDINQIEVLAGKTLKTANEIGGWAISAFTDNASSGKKFIVCFILIGALIGLVFATLLTRGITGPIKRIVGGLTEASDQVSAASSQVSGAGHELAEGASEQAASIEETSSSLEEMASMTRQNAANAAQAKSLMTETSQVVSRANNSMAQLTVSMTEISKASQETSKIVKTIDEIAFQTNLLALNAAVEAARAGEAGAGFAVVADEVRHLAMRAADAAKNTAHLIEGTVNKIKEGSGIVEKTSVEFSHVASSAVKMSDLVGEIAVSSSEQSKGIEQLNKAVSAVEQVVQRNASNAEESASASEEMNAQAVQMNGFVRDLVVIVGGTANGCSRNSTSIIGKTEAKKTVHGPLDLFAVHEKKGSCHIQNIQKSNEKDSGHSVERETQ
jgi:methyl-accepting chemotaxis protein